MTVRITRATVDGKLVIRIEGRLEGTEVSDLRAEFGSSPAGLTLDLSGLLSADAAAIEVLRSLRDNGAALTGGSVYVRHLLADRPTAAG